MVRTAAAALSDVASAAGQLTHLLFFFAGAYLARDSSSPFPRDLPASSCRLGVLAFSCCAPDVDDDVGLGDGLLTLRFSLSPSREGEDKIRRRLPGELTTGIRSRERLDDEVDDPADSPAPG